MIVGNVGISEQLYPVLIMHQESAETGGPTMDSGPKRTEISQSPLQAESVLKYYHAKTEGIIRKYGPGPDIHYHAGLFSADKHDLEALSYEAIRLGIINSQRALVSYAAESWPRGGFGLQLIDIGAGLGGPAIQWASQYAANITCLTNIHDHVSIIMWMAEEAGVSHLLKPHLADIHRLEGIGKFDSAFAFESTGYMHRPELFEKVRSALRPNSRFGIADHFVRDVESARKVDAYAQTRLGSLDEYVESAEQAGFTLDKNEDLSEHTAKYWMWQQGWAHAKLRSLNGSGPEALTVKTLRSAAKAYGEFRRMWLDHGLETRLLLFRLLPGMA